MYRVTVKLFKLKNTVYGYTGFSPLKIIRLNKLLAFKKQFLIVELRGHASVMSPYDGELPFVGRGMVILFAHLISLSILHA